MFKLLSRDGLHIFPISLQFMKYFNEVFLSENKDAYRQKKDIGTGRRKDSGAFNGLYAYDSTLELTFQTNYDNFDHPKVAYVESQNWNNTCCNYNVAEYLRCMGFTGLANQIKHDDWSANQLIDELQKTHVDYEIRKTKDPSPTAGASQLVATIACQYGEKSGHVAPVIGRPPTADTPFVSNIGVASRDGVVDIETAFGSTRSVLYFEIKRKD